MSVAQQISYIDESTLDRLTLTFDERDTYVVEGTNNLHRTLCVLSPEFEALSLDRSGDSTFAGNLLLTMQGTVLVCPTTYASPAESAALAYAAAELAASDEAVARRDVSSRFLQLN